MKKSDLILECQKRKIDDSGLKVNLIDRLVENELRDAEKEDNVLPDAMKTLTASLEGDVNNGADKKSCNAVIKNDSNSSQETQFADVVSPEAPLPIYGNENHRSQKSMIEARMNYSKFDPQNHVSNGGASSEYEMSVMKRELELIERERDLLLREREVLQRMDRLASMNKQKSHAVEHMLYEFDGSGNFGAWVNQLDAIQEEYEIDESGMKLLIVKKLQGKALKWFYSNAAHLSMSTHDLIRNMSKLYDQKINITQLKRNFEDRKWKRDENFTDYFHDKIVLSNSLNYSDNELVQYIIEGIPDENLQSQAIMHQFQATEQLLQAFRELHLKPEISEGAVAGNYSKSKVTHQKYGTFASNSNSSQAPEKNGGAIKKVVRCFNCNEYGHGLSHCPHPKRERGTCYKCGELGHYSAQCPKLKDVNSGMQN